MSKGKDKPKGKKKPTTKAKPPKARHAPRHPEEGWRDDEDLFAHAPVTPRHPKATSKRKALPKDAAPLPTDLDEIRAEHERRVAREEDGEPRPLNPRQRLFAEHYAKLGNATQAYKLAGYTGGTEEAYQNSACRLLGHVGVRKYIGELLDDAAAPRIADAAERHQFLTAVMRGEIKGRSHFYGEEYETSPAMNDRIKAAELLSKINGDLTEKREVKGDLIIKVVRGDSAPSAIGKREGDGE